MKAKDNYSIIDSLIEDGINYLEYRSIDINPFDKAGISLENIKKINEELNLEKEDILNKMIEKIKDYKLTYAHKIIEKVKEEGYVEAHLNLAKVYKEEAYKNRFKLEGYEDLELLGFKDIC